MSAPAQYFRVANIIFDCETFTLDHDGRRPPLNQQSGRILCALCEAHTNGNRRLSCLEIQSASVNDPAVKSAHAATVQNKISLLRREAKEGGLTAFIAGGPNSGYYISENVEKLSSTTEPGPSKLAFAACSAEALMKCISSEGRANRAYLLIVESRQLLELHTTEFISLPAERALNGIRAAYLFESSDTARAAEFVANFVDGVKKRAPSSLEDALRHVWLIFVPRLASIPTYTLNAENPIKARRYILTPNGDVAIEYAAGQLVEQECRGLGSAFAQPALTFDADHPHPSVVFAPGVQQAASLLFSRHFTGRAASRKSPWANLARISHKVMAKSR